MEILNKLPIYLKNQIIQQNNLVYRNGVYMVKINKNILDNFQLLYTSIPKIYYHSKLSAPCIQILIKGTKRNITFTYFSHICSWHMDISIFNIYYPNFILTK